MESPRMPALPPAVDAPEFCFCGRKTIEPHEYWYCSTECARGDALRSLDDPECHYRNVIRNAYIRAGARELFPRRVVSVDHLRPGPSGYCCLAIGSPPLPAPTDPLPNPPSERNASHTQDRDVAGFPTLSQVTGKILTKKAAVGEPLVAGRQDRPRWEGFPDASSRACPSPSSLDQHVAQIDLDAIPLTEPVPVRSLRHVPQSTNSLRNNIRKSVMALLKARKDKEAKSPERVFGHPMSIVIPPMRKESLPSQYRKSPSSPLAVPERSSKALRRSVSFAGWNANPQESEMPSDPLMFILEELREECAGGFDPRSFFDEEVEAF